VSPDPPTVDRLSEIGAPALILVGDSDQPRTLAAADLLASGLPNAQKVVMAGVAHLPNMERPEEFNRILLDYLEEVR
jgi:pimeloyl-ACP methyl ester carboxylesterase